MSFSKEVKKEVLLKEPQEDSLWLSFLSGLLNSSAIIDVENSSFILNTELNELANKLIEICNKMYGDVPTIENVKGHQIKKNDYFRLYFEPHIATKILIDTGLVNFENGKIKRCFPIDEYMIKDEESLKYFVQGAFVGCGTSSIKINKSDRLSTGYHLEFASKNYEFLSGLGHILAQFDVSAKLVLRKNLYILYVKDANEVSNVLALMGAYNAVLDLQNEMALRTLRNKVNRQTNCMSANINKTVNASIKQNDAISKIVSKIGLEDLPTDLQNVALLRMANPEESLEDLVKLASFEITKSGLSYRLNKLIKIADKIKE